MSLDVVLATVGSAGDVLPLVAVGSALRARGHRVSLAANPAFREPVEAAGIELVPTGTVADYERVMADPGLWSPMRSFGVVARQAVIPAMPVLYEHLAGRDPARTVVAASVFAFGARLAQERLHLPLVTVHLQPTAFLSAYDHAEIGPVRPPAWLPTSFHARRLAAVDRLLCDPILAPPVNEFRSRLALPPVRRVFGRWAPSPQANLGLFPEWFARVRPDWPPGMRLTGFVPGGDTDDGLADDVTAFLRSGDPPVVVTFGSSMRHARDLFGAALAANRGRGRRTILLTQFPDQVPDGLDDDVLHVPWAPLGALLPHAAAVVHHGGIGTVAQVLRAGVPHLVVPFAHDQPDNANRLVRLGVAARLDRRRFTADRAAMAIDTLLDPRVLTRCAHYAGRVDLDAAVHDAAAVIVQAGGER